MHLENKELYRGINKKYIYCMYTFTMAFLTEVHPATLPKNDRIPPNNSSLLSTLGFCENSTSSRKTFHSEFSFGFCELANADSFKLVFFVSCCFCSKRATRMTSLLRNWC